jgi:hypothetical protein
MRMKLKTKIRPELRRACRFLEDDMLLKSTVLVQCPGIWDRSTDDSRPAMTARIQNTGARYFGQVSYRLEENDMPSPIHTDMI